MDLHFNQSLANGYHSGSQISRVLTEDWMERNMFCPVCGTYLPEHMHNKSEAYQGPKYFSYEGKTLWEIRLMNEDKL